MNIYIDVQSPAVKQAGAMASLYGLEHHGLTNLRRVYWNLPVPALYEEAIHRSGQPAVGQRRLSGELGHAQPLVR